MLRVPGPNNVHSPATPPIKAKISSTTGNNRHLKSGRSPAVPAPPPPLAGVLAHSPAQQIPLHASTAVAGIFSPQRFEHPSNFVIPLFTSPSQRRSIPVILSTPARNRLQMLQTSHPIQQQPGVSAVNTVGSASVADKKLPIEQVPAPRPVHFSSPARRRLMAVVESRTHRVSGTPAIRRSPVHNRTTSAVPSARSPHVKVTAHPSAAQTNTSANGHRSPTHRPAQAIAQSAVRNTPQVVTPGTAALAGNSRSIVKTLPQHAPQVGATAAAVSSAPTISPSHLRRAAHSLELAKTTVTLASKGSATVESAATAVNATRAQVQMLQSKIIGQSALTAKAALRPVVSRKN